MRRVLSQQVTLAVERRRGITMQHPLLQHTTLAAATHCSFECLWRLFFSAKNTPTRTRTRTRTRTVTRTCTHTHTRTCTYARKCVYFDENSAMIFQKKIFRNQSFFQQNQQLLNNTFFFDEIQQLEALFVSVGMHSILPWFWKAKYFQSSGDFRRVWFYFGGSACFCKISPGWVWFFFPVCNLLWWKALQVSFSFFLELNLLQPEASQ